MAASFLVLVVAAIVAGHGWCMIGALVVLFLLALQRMHRVSKHYALELFVQYILIGGAPKG